jgi:hypothetical protein
MNTATMPQEPAASRKAASIFSRVRFARFFRLMSPSRLEVKYHASGERWANTTVSGIETPMGPRSSLSFSHKYRYSPSRTPSPSMGSSERRSAIVCFVLGGGVCCADGNNGCFGCEWYCQN